jgi:hypothetical protein
MQANLRQHVQQEKHMHSFIKFDFYRSATNFIKTQKIILRSEMKIQKPALFTKMGRDGLTTGSAEPGGQLNPCGSCSAGSRFA